MHKLNSMKASNPIGIFDSGYGGLTVFREIHKELPQYDYIYLGDNARVPYGTRSFDTVYEFTKQCVFKLFELGCDLVILACNTASAKALRTIQQQDLPAGKKVLGVIRPTTETIHQYTQTNHVGILATQGTVLSDSYPIEIAKFHPEIKVFQQACPFWVPLVENNEIQTEGAQYFVQKDIEQLLTMSNQIDTIVLACTHYPILYPIIRKYVPNHIQILAQGHLVSKSLRDYLERHTDLEEKLSKEGNLRFFTTDDEIEFAQKAKIFIESNITAMHIKL